MSAKRSEKVEVKSKTRETYKPTIIASVITLIAISSPKKLGTMPKNDVPVTIANHMLKMRMKAEKPRTRPVKGGQEVRKACLG